MKKQSVFHTALLCRPMSGCLCKCPSDSVGGGMEIIMTYATFFHDHFSFIQYGEFGLRILVAGLCGIAIGYERTMRLKEAGIRTHLIVCLASALMMIVSKYGFADLIGSGGSSILGTDGADPARIAAQVITGVGFLGAGVIFHNGNSVKGLTTAAGLWATAGIGITIGAGMYSIGIFASLVIVITQILLHKLGAMDNISTTHLRFSVKNTEEFKKEIQQFIDSQHAEILESKIKYDDDGYVNYNITLKMNHEITFEEISKFLESKGEVKSVSCTSTN